MAVSAALSTMPAKAAPGCPSPFTTVGESTCVVPTNATSVTFTAIGGSGASSGGVGDSVQATFPVGAGDAVSPGETLYVEVGGNASGSSGGANGGGAGGSGSFASDGGGGGGASDVRSCSVSTCSLSSSDTRRVVAAGDGGGGVAAAETPASREPMRVRRTAAGRARPAAAVAADRPHAGRAALPAAAALAARAAAEERDSPRAATQDVPAVVVAVAEPATSAVAAAQAASVRAVPRLVAGGGGGADFVAPAATSHSSTANTGRAAPSVTVSFALTGTLTVTKHLITSSNDPAKFNLRIDGTTYAANVGNGGTTGAITVAAGSHTVSETAGTNANLGNYTTRIECSDGSSGYGTSLSGVQVGAGSNVSCTITNTRKLFEA